jgi:hypothetical protein
MFNRTQQEPVENGEAESMASFGELGTRRKLRRCSLLSFIKILIDHLTHLYQSINIHVSSSYKLLTD